MPVIRAEELRDYSIAAYEAAGTPPEHAQIVVAHQVGANLVGHDSHGVVLLPTYIERIDKGHIVPTARPELLQESPATLAVNGNWGFGPVISEWTMERVIEKARQTRVAVATVLSSTAPLFAVPLGVVFLGERLPPIALVGAGVAVVGVVVLKL